tara:strand:- start:83 stop:760 length:678 start_codon:yes stop_codon:yes gene_type:complete
MDENNAVLNIQKTFRGYNSRKNTVLNIIKGNPEEWSNLIILYGVFGESLNENDMKFMKGKLYEIFFSKKSKLFKHVDLEGYDIICMGIKIEIKFKQTMLLTNKRNLQKTITFRCKNSNGSNSMNISKVNTAHIYILLQRDAIGYVMGIDVLKYLHGIGDLDAKIPNKYVNLIWKYEKNIEINNNVPFNLSVIITEIYKCICNSIWNNLDWRNELRHCLYSIAYNL